MIALAQWGECFYDFFWNGWKFLYANRQVKVMSSIFENVSKKAIY